jgi:CHAT domain
VQAAQHRTRQLWECATATLGEVRKLPGLERYLMSAGFNEIKQAAADFPVLYLWTSRHDTAAILVLGDGTMLSAFVDGLNNEMLGKILRDWVASIQLTVTTTGRQRRVVLATLGEVLKPYVPNLLHQILTKRYSEDPQGDGWRWGPVTLVVSGLLSYFPVHAWSPYIADRATGQMLYHMPLMYTPSARQALTARRPPRSARVSGRLLSIADPEPLADGLPPLPLARVEAALVARTAREPLLLQGQQATPQAFLERAGRYEAVHLACHGSAGTGAPGSAWLALGGARLSLDEIINHLVLDDTALVLLSACRSGQPDSVIPEESLDVGSMFLAAGARAVVATMWPVDELAATLFSWQLFLLWDWGSGLPLPAAVHAARLWLRDLTVADLTAIGRAEPALQPAVKRYTRLLDPAMKRFNEPYYWAPFAYTGG